MRYANRKDMHHAEIVAGLEACGVCVYDMPKPGDLLMHFQGVWMPCEVKTVTTQGATFKSGKAKKQYRLTKSQQAQPVKIPIVTDLQSALALFGI